MGALDGIRILECGELVAAPYVAKLLAHLGADVVKIEPPDGDPARGRGPFPRGEAHPERSGLHLYINQAKRSVVVDWSRAADVERFRRLATADALLVSGSPRSIEQRGLTYERLRDVNPRLVVATITPFGMSRPSVPLRGSTPIGCLQRFSGMTSATSGVCAKRARSPEPRSRQAAAVQSSTGRGCGPGTMPAMSGSSPGARSPRVSFSAARSARRAALTRWRSRRASSLRRFITDGRGLLNSTSWSDKRSTSGAECPYERMGGSGASGPVMPDRGA
jgi:hypothetical protein